MLPFLRPRRSLAPESALYQRALIEDLRFELVPMKNIDQAIADLPPGSQVTVTCSPVKGVEATLEITETLAAEGHIAVPHLAARMVESTGHLDEIAGRLTAAGLHEVFVIAGDAEKPHGRFADSMDLLEDLLPRTPDLRRVGFGAYPDGHALIDDGAVRDALHRKQAIIHDAGCEGIATTQMCFASRTIREWLIRERDEGFTMAVHLGVPGVVDRTKLMSMGMRLGVGPSLRYLRKNRSALTRLMSSPGYQPDRLLDPLADDLQSLGITGLHVFTFNQVAATETWRQSMLERLRVG